MWSGVPPGAFFGRYPGVPSYWGRGDPRIPPDAYVPEWAREFPDVDWSGIVDEFLLSQSSIKLELGGEFRIPTPPPFVAFLSITGEYRQFKCLEKGSSRLREGFEADLEVSLEGGIGAGYSVKRQGAVPPAKLDKAARRAYKRKSADPLPWYNQWTGLDGAVGAQFDSGADGNCFCPDAKVAIVVSVMAKGRGTAIFVNGEIKGSIEWDLSTPFTTGNFDAKVESTLGFRIGAEAALTVGGEGKGTWLGYFEEFVE